jgi:tRNA nucleotidyltransferase/poly(A) polymerase
MTYKRTSLERTILSDRYNKIIFQPHSCGEVFLVGGYIRDLLINRKCYDRDYVIEGPFERRVREIADATGGRVVRMGTKGLSRIIVDHGITLDFSPLKSSIEHDLSMRDFTLNALAWSPRTGLIDSYDGIRDLSNKRIRMLKASNLQEDPVRVVRAYRFAGELLFAIETATRRALKLQSPLLTRSKSERITLEFFRILELHNAPQILSMMLLDGPLTDIISNEVNKLRGQIRVLSAISETIEKLPLKYKEELPKVFAQHLSFNGLLKLTIMLSDDPTNRLCLGSRIKRFLALIERGNYCYRKNRRLSRAYLFDLFETTKDASIGFLIINKRTEQIADYELYQRIVFERLISADRIRKISGPIGGKELGSLIYSLRKAIYTGRVKCEADAVHFLKSTT